ncbi:MAG: PHP domain-containing protein [Varibaculum cambriense]|uniref:PHP domain-containing protein n=1 Tax=Varibaculum cambriense TaxID=184870 RepID=UPI001ED00A11|nr:PHP domain-containing protein [Varibaculum cambriense]MBS5918816.1 PHP domain-containing protein [Varibaculum cambriense]
MAAARIDLHTHSCCSDGTDTPEQVMLLAAQAGLDVVALTDHDTLTGIAEASKMVPKCGVSLVPGVEISTSHQGITAHLLAYLPDLKSQVLPDLFEKTVQARQQRMRQMVQRLSQDFDISYQEVLGQAGSSPIGRPHVADVLVKAGYFPNRSAAFEQVLATSSKYYVHYQAPDTVYAVEQVIKAGGLPVLAHPRSGGRQRRFLSVATIAQLKEAGLFALEAFHPEQTSAEQVEVSEIAQELGLFVTGSSDYHGGGKPNQLGQCLTAPEVFAEICSRGAGELVCP